MAELWGSTFLRACIAGPACAHPIYVITLIYVVAVRGFVAPKQDFHPQNSLEPLTAVGAL